MATDIKSVNTKLICNGEDLSKKLNDGVADVEKFAKAASKEITVPVGTKSIEAQKQTPAGVQTPEATAGGGVRSFVTGMGRELFSQFKSADPTKGFEIGKGIDSVVSTVSAGLATLGPKGLAAAAALEAVNFAGQKAIGWLSSLVSVDQSAARKQDPMESPFLRNLKAADNAFNDLKGFNKSLSDRIATSGMTGDQANLFHIEQQLKEKGITPNPEFVKELDRARQLVAQNSKIEADKIAEANRLRDREFQAAQARAFTEGLGGRAGRARGDVRDMTNWLNAGLINERQFGEGALNTIEGLERTLGLGGRGRALAGAASADSVEGVNAILSAQNVDGPRTMEERLNDLKTAIEKKGDDTTKKIDELLNLLRNRPGLVAGLIQ